MTTNKSASNATNVFTIRKIKNEASKKQFKDAQARAKAKPLSTLNPKINTTLLILIQDAIKAHPEHFDMRGWYGEKHCGTTACIAGWAMQFDTQFKTTDIEHIEVKPIHPERRAISTAAQTMLGMTEYQGYRLFHADCWIPTEHIEKPNSVSGVLNYIDQILDGKIPTFNRAED